MNIVTSVYDKFDYFDDPNQVLSLIVNPQVREAPQELKGDIQTIFSYVDSNTSSQMKGWIIDMMEELTFYEGTPAVFLVHKGESLQITLCLSSGQDWSNLAITVRKADDNTILSPVDTLGDSYSNAPEQYAYIKDIALTEGEFYKTHVLLEETDESNEANGDAVTHLTDAYVLVLENIDNTA